jgi:hypothetical protein
MSTCEVEDAAVLNHDVDDLLLHARGLVLVREVLARRGASRAELDAHTRELERVRRKLVETIGGRTAPRGPSDARETEHHLVAR